MQSNLQKTISCHCLDKANNHVKDLFIHLKLDMKIYKKNVTFDRKLNLQEILLNLSELIDLNICEIQFYDFYMHTLCYSQDYQPVLD